MGRDGDRRGGDGWDFDGEERRKRMSGMSQEVGKGRKWDSWAEWGQRATLSRADDG